MYRLRQERIRLVWMLIAYMFLLVIFSIYCVGVMPYQWQDMLTTITGNDLSSFTDWFIIGGATNMIVFATCSFSLIKRYVIRRIEEIDNIEAETNRDV